MHLEAFVGFGGLVEDSDLDTGAPLRILDVGGQDVNTTGQGFDLYTRFTHPETTITTLDLYRADIIADAATWEPDRSFDVVMSTELFEHISTWREVIAVMRRALDPDGFGVFLSTCASTGRGPHGMHGAERPGRNEYYGNVAAYDLEYELDKHFSRVSVRHQFPPGDAYAWARI